MSEATRIPELFGSLVFNERTMEQYVPQSAMDVWRGCLKSGQPLPLSAANEIADAMKTWALEHGATHFTHWFQRPGLHRVGDLICRGKGKRLPAL